MDLKAALLSFISLVPSVVADCRSFEAITRSTGDTGFTKSSSNSYRISTLVNCTSGGSSIPGNPNPQLNLRCNSTQCPLASEDRFYIQLNRTLNVTVSSNVADNLFQVARASLPLLDTLNFNASWVYRTSGVGSCIAQGRAGYWSYTPTYVCTQGRFSECSGEGYPAGGTAVELCAVKMLSDGKVPLADGTISIVTTSGIPSEPAPPNATLSSAQQSAGSGDSGNGSPATPPSSAGMVVLSPSALLLGLLSTFVV